MSQRPLWQRHHDGTLDVQSLSPGGGWKSWDDTDPWASMDRMDRMDFFGSGKAVYGPYQWGGLCCLFLHCSWQCRQKGPWFINIYDVLFLKSECWCTLDLQVEAPIRCNTCNFLHHLASARLLVLVGFWGPQPILSALVRAGIFICYSFCQYASTQGGFFLLVALVSHCTVRIDSHSLAQ